MIEYTINESAKDLLILTRSEKITLKSGLTTTLSKSIIMHDQDDLDLLMKTLSDYADKTRDNRVQ